MKILLISIVTFLISASIFSQQSRDSVFAIISSDTIHIWNTGAYENCGCLFKMDVSMYYDTIYVTEVDTANTWAFCLCYFDLCASITGLQSGNYFVEVYRNFLLDPDSVYYIGSTSFIYSGSALTFFSQSYQSACYNISEVEGYKEYPKEFTLEQNFPNPFNPGTKISYSIPTSPSPPLLTKERVGVRFVTLKVYDILGKEVAVLVNEEQPAGVYEVNWNAANLPSGVYFYKLQAGSFVETMKMILLK
jgi:hypothetical protein